MSSSSSSSSSCSVISHYKRKMERHPSDSSVLLHCLSKLDRVEVNIALLQETGIGRIVNSLKKSEQEEVAEKARLLVSKWKDVVAKEDDGEETPGATGNPSNTSDQEEANARTDDSPNQIQGDSPEDEDNQGSDSSSNTNSRVSSSSSSSHQKKHKKKKSSHSSERSSSHHSKSSSSSSSNGSQSREALKASDSFGNALMSIPSSKKAKKSSSSSNKEEKRTPETSSSSSAGGSSSSSKSRSSSSSSTSKKSHSDSSHSRSKHDRPSEPSSAPNTSSSSSSSATIPSDPLLPAISPHYKPLPQPSSSLKKDGASSNDLLKKFKDDDEALSNLISMSKSSKRTAVFSGIKKSGYFGPVPTLMEMCITVLQENVDDIYECGGLDYITLKPILERASPQTLAQIEEHNHYLMTETGDLWERFCRKNFPKGKRQEMESWREMFERCTVEREEKLNLLKVKVKDSYKKVESSYRQTKLAYVGTAAKPPRSVFRAQAKNGTAFGGPLKRPLASSSSSSSSSSRTSSSSSSSSSAPKKPKVAPLMSKTLKMARGIKGGFRR